MFSELFPAELYRFNLFAVPTLLTAITMLALGMKVLLRERNSRVSISFFVMTLTAALWLASYSFMYCAQTRSIASAWSVLGHLGIAFIPASVYHFTVTALQRDGRYGRRVLLAWAICAAFFAAILFSRSFLTGVHAYPWGYYPLYGTLGVLFICFFFGLMALSLREYWITYHSSAAGVSKQRTRALLIAFCVAYLGSFDYLPALGVTVYPLGYMPVLGFIILVNHTIKRYRLVSVTPELAAKEIIQAMDEALLVADNDGIVRVANPRACHFFSRAEMEGTSVSTLAQAFADDNDSLTRTILDGTLRDYECSARDGKTVSISSFAMRDINHQPIATVCMIRDITQAKAAEHLIERYIAEQTALYELNLAAISTLKLDAILQVLADHVEKLFPQAATTVLLVDQSDDLLRKVGCRGIDENIWRAGPDISRNRVLPQLLTNSIIELPDIRGPMDDLVEAAFFARRGFTSYLGVPLVTQNRVIGVLSLYARGEQRYSGEDTGFLRRLAAQAAVAIHNSELYEQIRRQAEALEKANRVKEDFLSVMSHELRTPLNVISGYTKLMQEGILGSTSDEQQKALDKISRHSAELLFMVSSIMNATKIEADALTLDLSEFLLAELLAELEMLYDYPRAKPVRLEWDYPNDLPALHSDSDKIKHILQNLINNALKFTDVGNVTVTARQLGKQAVELTVSDTGIGISAENLPRIFDRFRQMDGSKTRLHGGVGLGLHIVKTFTELLGGTIKVESRLGSGSNFTITLPLSEYRTGKDSAQIATAATR